MSWEALGAIWAVVRLPQVWTTGAICLALLAKSMPWKKGRKWKRNPLLIDDFVELMAYAAALWGVSAIFHDAIAPGQDPALGFAKMLGTVLLALVAGRGAWRVWTREEAGTAKPGAVSDSQKDVNNPPGT